HHPVLHSFPTRRSSDLDPAAGGHPGASGGRRPQLRGARRLARLPSAEPLRPDDPRERPLLPRRESGRGARLVVRRRLRPDALLPVPRRRARLAPGGAGDLRAVRRGRLSPPQALVRRVLPFEAPGRDPRRRRPVLRRSRRRGLFPQLRVPARGGGRLPRRLPADRRAPARPSLGRARARVPAPPPGALRRVQPAVRSRHPVRHPVARQDRIDPDVAAAAGRLGLRLAPRAGDPGGRASRLPPPARLARGGGGRDGGKTERGRADMRSRWSEGEAGAAIERWAAAGEDLALRVYTSRLIGAEPDLVLHGGGNTSVKSTFADLLGEPVSGIFVKGSGWDLAAIEPQGLPGMHLDPLRRLRALPALADEEMVNQ